MLGFGNGMRFTKRDIKGYELSASSLRSHHTKEEIKTMEEFYDMPLRKGGDEYGLVDDHTCFALFVYDGAGKFIQKELFEFIDKFREYFDTLKDPSYILSGANKILYEQNKPREYPIHGTAFLGLFFNDGKVVYSNAGHEIPFLISSDKGVAALSASPQIALGIIVDPYYKSYETQLNSGDILILYTDGLTDARSHDNQMDFYDSRIIADLREIRENMNGNFKSFSKTLLQKSLGFSDRKVPKDDTIVIAIQKS